jgi:hypothetical protein
MKIIDVEDFQVDLARIPQGSQSEPQEKAEKREAESFHGDILEDREDDARKTSGGSVKKFAAISESGGHRFRPGG